MLLAFYFTPNLPHETTAPFSALCLLLFYSCTSPRYVTGPTALNAPYFVQKHDSKIGAFISGNGSSTDTDYVRGYDFMAAYAVTNHVALTVSYHRRLDQNQYFNFRNDPFDSSLVQYRCSAWEAGGGYFLPLDNRKIANLGFYAGIGSGSFTLSESGRKGSSLYSRQLLARPFKFYLQPAFYIVTDVCRFAFTYRYSWVQYNQVQSNYTPAEETTFRLDGLSGRTLSFKELSFDLQLRHPKIPWLGLEGQMSISSKPFYYYTRTFNVSGGLVIDPYLLLKK